ncbi:hypothetical protein DFH06DRAFT_1130045 [Mycena polygramma]|nr:hypothetical protein DFH06DRAFT_1130045 [Mycena polygramma]
MSSKSCGGSHGRALAGGPGGAFVGIACTVIIRHPVVVCRNSIARADHSFDAYNIHSSEVGITGWVRLRRSRNFDALGIELLALCSKSNCLEGYRVGLPSPKGFWNFNVDDEGKNQQRLTSMLGVRLKGSEMGSSKCLRKSQQISPMRKGPESRRDRRLLSPCIYRHASGIGIRGPKSASAEDLRVRVWREPT